MSFKSFDLAHDVASVVSSINEVVLVSSSIYASDNNVKFYTNIASSSAGADLGGYFQTVFDSSPTSSLSTSILDLTYGYATGSVYNTPATLTSSQNEKIKIYRMMASSLLGNPDSVFNINNTNTKECFFVMIKRGIQKDEIKKGTTAIGLNIGTSVITGSDDGAVVSFKQTVGGDYAPLKRTDNGNEIGQIWYNAGIIVIGATPDLNAWASSLVWSGSVSFANAQSGCTINQVVDGLRLHVDKVALHNQTNLYSTIYFCRAFNSEFNYSSNPTYVDDNKRIRVTSGSNILTTRTYITTAGLYDANDNLLAVAKVNKPLTKTPDNENTLRIRLDY
jgi:hypothetical protein